MIEVYDYAGMEEKKQLFQKRTEEIKKVVNENAWDGEWYIYGFTGSGKPIGSKTNKEGKIHLNVQTWPVFSGLAPKERADIALNSVDKHLMTKYGPMLLHPPYVKEGGEVGRIARLEPGTFENGSIYQHAVAFYVYACIINGDYDKAYDTLSKVLPVNPENFDCRRTSEPYCTGNYYCGASHPRMGQNFFTWFTGNAPWFLRIAFDYILGVKPNFNGLEINPHPPSHWDNYKVIRVFKGIKYEISFIKNSGLNNLEISVDGNKISDNKIPLPERKLCKIECRFP